MRSQVWATFVALSALGPSVVAAQNSNYFINPPNSGIEYDMSSNPVYKVGDKISVSWTMTYDQATVYIQQATNPEDNYQVLMQDTSDQALTWTVDVSSFNLKGTNSKMVSANTFWLLVINNSDDDSFSSHYFNVTDPSATKTTTTMSTTTTSTSAATTTSKATVTSSHATDTAAGAVTGTPKSADPADATSTVSVSNAGMTSAQKAGLGVGLGLGIPAIAAIAGGLFWFLRRRRGPSYHRVSVANMEGPAGPTAGSGVFGGHTSYGGAAGFYKSPADFASPKMQASDSKVMYGGGPHDASALVAHPVDSETKIRPISELDATPRPLEPVEMPAEEVRR